MAGRVGLALRSRMSATNRIISSSVPRPLLGARRNGHHHNVAAPIFGQEAAIGELLLDTIHLGLGAVDLVDRDDDGNLGGAGVIDGFDAFEA